jgi:hypothetical protein
MDLPGLTVVRRGMPPMKPRVRLRLCLRMTPCGISKKRGSGYPHERMIGARAKKAGFRALAYRYFGDEL